MIIIFIATFIQSAIGFGEAIIAVPLLSFFIPLTIATPLIVLLSIIIALIILIQDWEKIHFRSLGLLIFSSLIGIPLGIILLKSSSGAAGKIILAIFIILYSIYSLYTQTPPELKKDNSIWLLCCGFIAGILGGAYGMNGPPVVVYGSMRRWSAQNFRSTLQGYFLPASIIAIAGYWHAGLWVPSIFHYFLLSLPIIVPAILLGRAANKRLNRKTFFNYIYLGLIGVGLLLLTETIL